MNTNKPRNELKRSNLIGSANGIKHVGLLGWFSSRAMHCELKFFYDVTRFSAF